MLQLSLSERQCSVLESPRHGTTWYGTMLLIVSQVLQCVMLIVHFDSSASFTHVFMAVSVWWKVPLICLPKMLPQSAIRCANYKGISVAHTMGPQLAAMSLLFSPWHSLQLADQASALFVCHRKSFVSFVFLPACLATEMVLPMHEVMRWRLEVDVGSLNLKCHQQLCG